MFIINKKMCEEIGHFDESNCNSVDVFVPLLVAEVSDAAFSRSSIYVCMRQKDERDIFVSNSDISAYYTMMPIRLSLLIMLWKWYFVSKMLSTFSVYSVFQCAISVRCFKDDSHYV